MKLNESLTKYCHSSSQFLAQQYLAVEQATHETVIRHWNVNELIAPRCTACTLARLQSLNKHLLL